MAEPVGRHIGSEAFSRLESSQARAVSSSSSWQRACGPWEWWMDGEEKERGHKLCDRVFAQLLSLLNLHTRVVQIFRSEKGSRIHTLQHS